MKKSFYCFFLLLVVQTLLVSRAEASFVKIRLQTTDLTGTALPAVTVGDNFLLQTWVEDLRNDPQGVFAAYLDVLYDSSLMSLAGAIIHSSDYPNGQSGSTVTPGLIDEVGSFSTLTPSGAGEFLLFSIVCHADTVGIVSLVAEEADILPKHDVLLYGVNNPISTADIAYLSTSLNITAVPLPASFSFLTIGLTFLFFWRNKLKRKD